MNKNHFNSKELLKNLDIRVHPEEPYKPISVVIENNQYIENILLIVYQTTKTIELFEFYKKPKASQGAARCALLYLLKKLNRTYKITRDYIIYIPAASPPLDQNENETDKSYIKKKNKLIKMYMDIGFNYDTTQTPSLQSTLGHIINTLETQCHDTNERLAYIEDFRNGG